jgi:hypothetical protein
MTGVSAGALFEAPLAIGWCYYYVHVSCAMA